MNEGFHGDLQEAVSGLAGLVGLMLMPTIAAWLRLLLQWLESDRSGLGRNQRFSGMSALRAILYTCLLGFLGVSQIRAAAQLRQHQLEAPVFTSTITGIAVGVAFWALYALALRTVTRDWRSARQRRRIR